MTEKELFDKIETLKPKVLRPYKIIKGEVNLLCIKCYVWKPIKSYTVETGGKRFFDTKSMCLFCQALKNREYLKRNPEKQKQFIEARKIAKKKEKEAEIEN